MTLRSCTNTHIVFQTLLGALILLQTCVGKFTWDDHATQHLTESFYISWTWWLVCFLPPFLLFLKKGGRTRNAPKVDVMALLAVVVFNSVAIFTIFMEPFASSTQGEWLFRSFLWIVPASILTCVMVKSGIEKETIDVA